MPILLYYRIGINETGKTIISRHVLVYENPDLSPNTEKRDELMMEPNKAA